MTPRLVSFLETLFRKACRTVVGSDRSLAPLLDRFTEVTVMDSTTLTLPDSMSERFPGCGGSHGSGKAAVKYQVELDLRHGGLSHVEVEAGRTADGGSVRQYAARPEGSLRITDLGYFSVKVFAAMMAAGVHFLSRLHYKTTVRTTDGVVVDLLDWLRRQVGPIIDRSIFLGPEQMGCRLIAWRLPAEVANRRRHKLRKETRAKYGREPSDERLKWCDWTILVTSSPIVQITAEEAIVLYRARWQIELLFKRWKSQGLVAELSGATVARQMVRVWSRLLAAVVQHWLMVGTVWGDPSRSLDKVWQAVRAFVGRLAAALDSARELERVLADMRATFAKTCRRDKRSKPGTFELLNDAELLDFCLT